MFSLWSDMFRHATRTHGWKADSAERDPVDDAADDPKQRLREEMRRCEQMRHSVW